jgi:hypothetical protein
MSWFSRKKAFEEEADILGVDFEAEFDAISNALNSLFQAGRVAAGGKLVTTNVYQDIPGASKTLVVPQASILLAVATFDFYAGANSTDFYGLLNIDGIAGPPALSTEILGASGNRRLPITQNYSSKLAAGNRTVKMQAKKNGTEAVVAELETTNTGFLYLLIPDPEP